MEEPEQIRTLRKEHNAAIEAYDFARARSIIEQIDTLRKGFENDTQALKTDKFKHENEERKEQLLGDWERTKAKITQEKKNVCEQFHARFQTLQQVHMENFQQLSLKHTIQVERELTRPVGEAEKLFVRSKLYARKQQWDLADACKLQATRIKKQVLKERRKACEASFKLSQARLKESHERELQLLEQKQAVVLSELQMKVTDYDTIKERKTCVGDEKAATKTIRLQKNLNRARRTRSLARSVAVMGAAQVG
jgi:hypothetical protein